MTAVSGSGGASSHGAALRLPAFFKTEGGHLPLLAVTIAIFIAFSFISPRVFPTFLNLQSMAFQFPEVGLLAIGVTLSMVAAGIDLSVVSIANLAGLSAAQFLHATGASSGTESWAVTVVAIVVALAVGAGCGAVNGILIGRVGITPILATLASSGLFGGAAIVWTGGYAVGGLPNTFLTLGQPLAFGVPAPLVIFAIGAFTAAMLLSRTGIGMQICLVGANLNAARLSGIRPIRAILATYAMSGVMAALAGLIIVARTSNATPSYGSSYVLLAVVIAVLGGVDLAGGFGTISGATLATICLAVVQSGFNTLGLNQFLYQIAQGVILAGVMGMRIADIGGFLDAVRARRQHPRSPAPTSPIDHAGSHTETDEAA